MNYSLNKYIIKTCTLWISCAHIHSIHSCEPSAKLAVENIFEAASVNNIAVISITDHSNVNGLDEALDVWKNGTDSTGKKFSESISFFPGVELKADAGKQE